MLTPSVGTSRIVLNDCHFLVLSSAVLQGSDLNFPLFDGELLSRAYESLETIIALILPWPVFRCHGVFHIDLPQELR
jgi:hypothetical protein